MRPTAPPGAGGILLASGLEGGDVAAVLAKMPDAREVRDKGEWALMGH